MRGYSCIWEDIEVKRIYDFLIWPYFIVLNYCRSVSSSEVIDLKTTETLRDVSFRREFLLVDVTHSSMNSFSVVVRSSIKRECLMPISIRHQKLRTTLDILLYCSTYMRNEIVNTSILKRN